MFKAKIKDVEVLRDTFSVISDLVSEANFNLTKEGIKLSAMDPANIAMVIFELPIPFFESYEVDEPQKIGLSMDNWTAVLKRAGNEEKIELELLPENKLQISFVGKTLRKFTIPLIDLKEEEQKIPKLTHPVKIEVNTKIFKEAIEDAGIVADNMIFEADKDKFIMKARSELSSTLTEINKNELVGFVVNQSAKASYSLDYLKKMVRAGKFFDTVVLKFGVDYPIQVDFLKVDKLKISFILAPRVESE